MTQEKPKATFDQAAASFLAYSKSRKRPFSHRADKTIVGFMERFFSGTLLEDISLGKVEEYLDWRRREAASRTKKGARHAVLSPSTLNRDLVALKTLIKRVVQEGRIDRYPLTGLKLFRETPRDRVLSGKEYQALLVQCADHLKPMVVLAYMTGMRKGEIVKLRWDQVRFKERVIILEAEDTKTHQKREIPLNDELLNMLGRVPRLMNSLEVFSYRGRAYRSDGVRKMTEFERHLTRLFGGLRSRIFVSTISGIVR